MHEPEPNNLRALRRSRMLSQAALAAKAGLRTGKTVSMIERGDRVGGYRARYGIAAALGVPVAAVFPDEPERAAMPRKAA